MMPHFQIHDIVNQHVVYVKTYRDFFFFPFPLLISFLPSPIPSLFFLLLPPPHIFYILLIFYSFLFLLFIYFFNSFWLICFKAFLCDKIIWERLSVAIQSSVKWMNLISAFDFTSSESFTVPPKNGVLEWHMGKEIHFLLSKAMLQLTYIDI